MDRETKLTQATDLPTLGAAPGSIVLGRYRVEAELGCGATSVVLAARSTAVDERVALKIWRSDLELEAATVQRVVRGARAAAAPRSEHVARIRDAGWPAGVRRARHRYLGPGRGAVRAGRRPGSVRRQNVRPAVRRGRHRPAARDDQRTSPRGDGRALSREAARGALPECRRARVCP